MKKIFNSYTQYQLLLFLLLKESDDEIVKIIIPKYLEEMKERIQKYYDVIVLEKPPSVKCPIKTLRYYIYIKKLKKKLNLTSEVVLYGDNILNYILPNYYSIYKLEDGTLNYIEKNNINLSKENKVIEIIKDIIFFIIFFKKRLTEKEKILNRIKGFYVTKVAPDNLVFKDKIIKIDLNKKWSEKNKKMQNEILDIFNFKDEIKNKKVILLTQPLSEDKYITEKEKIEIYSKILKNFSEKEIIIKTHPREKTEYKIYFPEYEILSTKIPLELLILKGVKIKKIVTLFSTGVFNVDKSVEVEFYGTEVHPKLLERFGSMEHIMKRNKFL